MTATRVSVSLGTRMLISTINCPVLVRTALCSMAHSSGASRLALVHRATQPGAAGAFAGAASASGAAGAGCVACAARGGGFGLGVCSGLLRRLRRAWRVLGLGSLLGLARAKRSERYGYDDRNLCRNFH